MRNGVPRILIIRLSAIGDVVRVLPALHTLRDAFPNAQIDWAIERKSAPIIEGHPALDNVLIFKRSSSWITATREFLSFCQQIHDNHYDIVIDFHGIFKTGMLLKWSHAPERFGFTRQT